MAGAWYRCPTTRPCGSGTAGPEDTVLLFLAGHVINEHGSYFFLPRDAERKHGRLRKSRMVKWLQLHDALQSARGPDANDMMAIVEWALPTTGAGVGDNTAIPHPKWAMPILSNPRPVAK